MKVSDIYKAIRELTHHNTCTRKIRYGHEETARQARSKLAAKGRQGLEIYHCKLCDGYHLGHKKGPVTFKFQVKRPGK